MGNPFMGDEDFADEDVAGLLAIIRDLRAGYSWSDLHLDTARLRGFYSRIAYMLEPDRERRADEWASDLLDLDWTWPREDAASQAL